MPRTETVWTVVILALALVCATPEAAEAANGGVRKDVEKRFDAAVKYYRVGEYDKAAKELDEMLKLSPTAAEAWWLREKVGLAQLTSFLRQPECELAAIQLLRSAGTRDEHLRRSPDEIKKLVKQLGESETPARNLAIHKLAASGPFAVPYLLDHACSNEPPSPTSKKLNAIITLRRIGAAGVAPLVAALWNCDDNAVGIIADLLSTTRDSRAVAPLMAIIENPRRSEFARKAATRALKQIEKPLPTPAAKAPKKKAAKPAGAAKRAKPAASRRNAAAACADLAERYYYADPVLIEVIPAKDRVIWTWNAAGKTFADSLNWKETPTYAYPRIMAHSLALRGLSTQPGSMRLKEIYVSNNYMYLEDAIAASDELAAKLESVIPLNEALGAPVIYASLKRAIDDRNGALARRCIESLRAIGDPRPHKGVASLISALAFKNLSVSANAAETLMHISPQGKLGGAEAVIDVIAVGLGARVRPRVAVVTTSDALAKFYLGALNRMTLRSARFNDLSDALRQAKNINRPIDVLLIDTRGNVKGVPVIVRNLRKDAVTASLPIILVGRKQDIEKLRGVCAGTVTAILPVAAEYKAIKSAFDLALAGRKAPSPTADIRKQEDLLRRVLTTIAVLPPKTAYPVEELSDAIAGMISGYPEDIRLLALKCVKRIGDSAKRDTVMALYTDADTPLVVRREAGDVFVALLPANPGLSDRQVKLLRNLTADPDPKIAACAVRALAIADIPDQERKRHTLDVDQKIPGLR